MKLNSHVAGAFCLQKADGLVSVEGDLAVGAVVTNGDVIFLGESNRFFEEGEIGHG